MVNSAEPAGQGYFENHQEYKAVECDGNHEDEVAGFDKCGDVAALWCEHLGNAFFIRIRFCVFRSLLSIGGLVSRIFGGSFCIGGYFVCNNSWYLLKGFIGYWLGRTLRFIGGDYPVWNLGTLRGTIRRTRGRGRVST